jgi:hypothetical protein
MRLLTINNMREMEVTLDARLQKLPKQVHIVWKNNMLFFVILS